MERSVGPCPGVQLLSSESKDGDRPLAGDVTGIDRRHDRDLLPATQGSRPDREQFGQRHCEHLRAAGLARSTSRLSWNSLDSRGMGEQPMVVL